MMTRKKIFILYFDFFRKVPNRYHFKKDVYGQVPVQMFFIICRKMTCCKGITNVPVILGVPSPVKIPVVW